MLALELFLIPLLAWTSAFQVFEQSASGLGRAYAGGAVIAEDASVITENPALMTLMKARQLSGNLILAAPYVDQSVTDAAVQTDVTGLVDFSSETAVTGHEGDSTTTALIPGLYYVHPLNKKWFLGGGVFSNFALAGARDDNYIGRFGGESTVITTINFNFSAAYTVNSNFRAGLGFNYVSGEALFTQAVPDVLGVSGDLFGPILAVLFPDIDSSDSSGIDGGRAVINGSGSGYGFNLGLVYQLNKKSRIGFSYHPSISLNLTGSAEFEGCTSSNELILGSLTEVCGEDFSVEIPLTLPTFWQLSYMQRVAPQWQVYGSWVMTYWSEFGDVNVANTSSGENFFTSSQNFIDSMRFAVGATWRRNKKMRFRFGLAYDQAPFAEGETNLQATDGDRTIIALGMKYAVSKNWSFDFGYSHYFFKTYSVSGTEELRNFDLGGIAELTTSSRLELSGVRDVDFLAAQFNWRF